MKTGTILLLGGAAVAAYMFLGSGSAPVPTQPAQPDPNAGGGDPYGAGAGGGYWPPNSGYPGAPMMPQQRTMSRREFARQHPHQWKHWGRHPGQWDRSHGGAPFGGGYLPPMADPYNTGAPDSGGLSPGYTPPGYDPYGGGY